MFVEKPLYNRGITHWAMAEEDSSLSDSSIGPVIPLRAVLVSFLGGLSLHLNHLIL